MFVLVCLLSLLLLHLALIGSLEERRGALLAWVCRWNGRRFLRLLLDHLRWYFILEVADLIDAFEVFLFDLNGHVLRYVELRDRVV